MKLNFQTYKSKVKGCFLGKNIGGTMGTPFEGSRGIVDLEYYTHDISKGVLPNDDLDLQMVWLAAAQRYGRALNADILAEYWLGYVVGEWSEYGVAKNNMRAGFPVGIANRYKNIHKDSCGCFIRSEIWACLAPGRPEIAVKYAYEDGVIDHADDGLWGEIFVAALESAAFMEKNIKKLIDIALSYIPADSYLTLGIKTAIDCYDSGLTWKEAYKKIMQTVPCGFGLDLGRYNGEPDPEIPEGTLGFDAPANISIAIMSLLYGEGDFSKVMCISAGCGEDADCTTGMAGAVMGIIYGPECIDEKWLVPIGDEIKTVAIDCSKKLPEGDYLPETVTELTERISKLMPTFVQEYFNPEDGTVEMSDEPYDIRRRLSFYYSRTIRERFELRNRGIKKENSLIEAVIIPVDGIEISEGKEKMVEFHFENMLSHHQWITVKADFPEEWECVLRESSVPIYETKEHSRFAKIVVKFTPRELKKGRYDVPVEIGCIGRLEKIHTNLVFMVE